MGDWQAGRIPAFLGLFLLSSVAVLSGCATNSTSAPEITAPVSAESTEGALGSGITASGNFLAGRFAQSQRQWSSASDYLLRALDHDPDNLELLQRASLALAGQGRLAEAAAIAERVLKYDGEAAISGIIVAEQKAKNGNWKAADAIATALPRRGISAFLVPMISAWSKMGQGQIDAALEALTPLSQTSGLSPMYDFHSGLINDLADRRAAAEGSYRNAVAGTGGLTLRTVEVIGAFYRRVGEPEQTKELVQRFIDTHPESTVHDFGGGSAPLVDGAKGGLAEAMFGMSGSLRQNNAPDVALIFGRMALDLQPNFPLAQVSVADLLQSQGNLDEANKIFRTIDPAAPVYWSTQLRLAANLEAVDDVDGAVKTLEALSVQHPNRPEAMITMADILRSHKRWEESVAAYDRALTMLDKQEHGNAPDRNHWTLYYSRGIALERSKQWTRAESDFLKALELSPDEPDVLNYLGYSWIEQGINLDKGKAMVEKAVAQRPTDGYIVDSLGWAYYRFQDFPKAVEVLERAIELHPEDPAINDHLGEALWSVGRKEEARFQWQRALIFKPDAELQAELEEKLKTRLAPPPPPIPTLPPAAPQKVAPEKLAPAKPTPEGK